MGEFHTIGVILTIIGSQFSLAGLHDIIIESNVIAEGSEEKIPSGKHYISDVRF